MNIGQRIREKRLEKAMTLKHVSSATGLTVTHLSDIERGYTQPSLKTLCKVAKGFGISTIDLIAGADEVGDISIEALPAGLLKLHNDPDWKEVLTPDWLITLQKIDHCGNRPQSKENYLDLFVLLHRILN